MTSGNPNALLRSLIVYAICVVMAVVVGYAVVDVNNSRDIQSLGLIGVLGAILVFPLLMKWHYPLLIFSCGLPATLFFLPGRPSLFVVMVAVSLSISVVERVLSRDRPFLPAAPVRWPLIAMLGVVYLTAKLTGGLGLRSLGSDVYGGKKYVFLIIGILSFFAFTARAIPKKHLNLYIALFCLSGLFSILSDLYPFVPSALQFIFLVFSPSTQSMDASSWQLGVTRLSGIAGAAGAFLFWMLARHGIRETFLTGKLWRPVVATLSIALIFLGGFRASIIGLIMILTLLFFMEKLHRTGMLLVVIMGSLLGAVILVPLAPHLPRTFQRALAFLPLDIAPDVRMDAEGSTEWRLEIWRALLPQVPKYLLLGKGYAFSQETFNESMGRDATFTKYIDASQNSFALSGDYHSGPLSLIIPFGIWGVLVWLWYWAAGFYVVWRNYKFGDPGLKHINIYLFVSFLAKIVTFLFIFGSFSDDVGGFAALIGFSIAANHGIRRPSPVAAATPVLVNPRLAMPGQPAWQR